MITANDLKTKGIACLEESLAKQAEAVISVDGKDSFVVMKIDHYHYLREMELEAAQYAIAIADYMLERYTPRCNIFLPIRQITAPDPFGIFG